MFTDTKWGVIRPSGSITENKWRESYEACEKHVMLVMKHYVLGTGRTHITIEFQPTVQNWVSEIEIYTNKDKLLDALIELRLITGFVEHPYSMETVFGIYEDYGGLGGYWVVCYIDERMGALAFPPGFGRLELAPIQTGDRFYIYLEGSLNEEDWPEGWTYDH